MILEAIDLTKATLEDASYGVNVQIDTIPIIVGDTRPPKIKKVLAPTRLDELASGELPPEWPVLVVTADEPLVVSAFVWQEQRNASRVPVWIRYVTGNVQEGAVGFRNACYTMRAIIRSLRLMMGDVTAPTPVRELNSVKFINAQRILAGPVSEVYGGLHVSALVVMEWTDVRDVAP